MNKIAIKCPHCGWEYLPEEIYTKLLGHPYNIVKSEKGEILFFEGNSLDLEEEYTCDNCGCSFKISLNNPEFVVKEIEDNDNEDDDCFILDLKK